MIACLHPGEQVTVEKHGRSDHHGRPKGAEEEQVSRTAKRTGLLTLAVTFSAGDHAASGSRALERDAPAALRIQRRAAIGAALTGALVFLMSRTRSTARWRSAEESGQRPSW